MTSLNQALRLAALCCGILIAAATVGCATPAASSSMTMGAADATSRRMALPEPFKTHIAVGDVTGGQETNPMWMSSVSSSDFERALEDSLRAVGLLAVNRQAGRFRLHAHLGKFDQPFVGLDMTVTATVTYTLVEWATGRTVFEKAITTPYTAKAGDAFLGVERLRLANEGAVRQNITGLIDELAQLKLSEPIMR